MRLATQPRLPRALGRRCGADHVALAREADRLGYARRLGGRGLRLRRPDGARVGRRADRAHRPRLGGHADPGAHPGDDRDDGGHARHAVRRPLPAGARRLRAAGVRGLARGALRQPARPARGSTSRSSGWRCAASRCAYAGPHFTLPLPDGPGKALRLTSAHPGATLPVYLAAVGPRNLELTGEIADGWLAIFFAPSTRGEQLAAARAGREAAAPASRAPDGRLRRRRHGARRRRRRPRGGRAAVARLLRALHRWHGQPRAELLQPARLPDGFRRRRRRIQDLYLAGRPREAAAAVPFEFIDATALIGPPERIARAAWPYAEAGVTTVSVATSAPLRRRPASRPVLSPPAVG